MDTKAFACYNLDENERLNSSSGGIYPLIARLILNKNGIVYAACYDGLEVLHKKIETEDGIKASQGSKYVDSRIDGIFRSVKQSLDDQRDTLFVGTPCQCAGLISYLEGSNTSKSKLLIIDFVCHGAPSKSAWNAYCKSRTDQGNDLAFVNMRDKTSGWSKGNYSWKEVTQNGNPIITPRGEVPYMKGMLANLYTRPSCFECQFKGVSRDTDITLGDYWGVWDCLPEMDDDKGTSLVLIHSEKGFEAFELIKDKIQSAEAELNKAIEANECLVKSTSRNAKSKEFYRRIGVGEDFISVVNNLTRISIMDKLKNKAKKIISFGSDL